MAKNTGNKELADESLEDEAVETVSDEKETSGKKSAEKPTDAKPAKDTKDKPARVDDKNKNGKDKKKDKKKDGGKFRRKVKDFFSELKKVTWPSFTKVLKQTGIVLVVTLCFLLVMMLFDYVFGLMYRALIGGLGGDTASAVAAMVRMVVFRGGSL